MIIVIGLTNPTSAIEQDVTDILISGALLEAVLAGEAGSKSALQALFNNVSGDSEAIADLAVELITSLTGDPVAITDAAILISDIASDILATQPIIRISIGDNFSLPEGTIGWDLGPPDSPTYAGFIKLTQHDKKIISGSSTSIEQPGGEGLLSDGLINVRKIFLNVDVPDGSYRLILMTNDLGNQSFGSPLGKTITVNGVSSIISNSSPDRWLSGGQFGSGDLGSDYGGATVIFVQVFDGRIVIEFEAKENSLMLLSGFILEPVDSPSVLYLPEDIFFNDEKILTAESRISDAIGSVLNDIIVGANNVEQREDILDLDEPEAETPISVSPN